MFGALLVTCTSLISLQEYNPLAHELTTGPEIIDAVVSTPSTPERPSSGKVDVFIAGAGTGGTVTGTARAIKKNHNPGCIIVGLDPVRNLFSFLSIILPLFHHRRGAFSPSLQV
jgi:cysteine synthase